MAIALLELLPAQVWPSAETAVESVTNHMPPGLVLAGGNDPTTVCPRLICDEALTVVNVPASGVVPPIEPLNPSVEVRPFVGESVMAIVPGLTCVPDDPVVPTYQLHVPGVPLPVERPQLEPNGDQPV